MFDDIQDVEDKYDVGVNRVSQKKKSSNPFDDDELYEAVTAGYRPSLSLEERDKSGEKKLVKRLSSLSKMMIPKLMSPRGKEEAPSFDDDDLIEKDQSKEDDDEGNRAGFSFSMNDPETNGAKPTLKKRLSSLMGLKGQS